MNAIVTTTINPPTEALIKFSSMNGWDLIIVGDKKTPHNDYARMEVSRPNVKYISPDEQEHKYPKLSQLIGWNCIQRRTFGFIEAFHRNLYDVVATVDDDNIPYAGWGNGIRVGTTAAVNMFDVAQGVFDPLSVTNVDHLWHRGFPIQLVPGKNNVKRIGLRDVNVLVQADLWDGEGDVDAIERINMKTNNRITAMAPFAGNKISPFNSQNTFISASKLPDYFLFPHIGRMDDIWASYLFQALNPNSVIYGEPSVCQNRNEHDISIDMKNEMIGYEFSLRVAENPLGIRQFIPEESWNAFIEYRGIMGKDTISS